MGMRSEGKEIDETKREKKMRQNMIRSNLKWCLRKNNKEVG
jgi:hypothetical protein